MLLLLGLGAAPVADLDEVRRNQHHLFMYRSCQFSIRLLLTVHYFGEGACSEEVRSSRAGDVA